MYIKKKRASEWPVGDNVQKKKLLQIATKLYDKIKNQQSKLISGSQNIYILGTEWETSLSSEQKMAKKENKESFCHAQCL